MEQNENSCVSTEGETRQLPCQNNLKIDNDSISSMTEVPGNVFNDVSPTCTHDGIIVGAASPKAEDKASDPVGKLPHQDSGTGASIGNSRESLENELSTTSNSNPFKNHSNEVSPLYNSAREVGSNIGENSENSSDSKSMRFSDGDDFLPQLWLKQHRKNTIQSELESGAPKVTLESPSSVSSSLQSLGILLAAPVKEVDKTCPKTSLPDDHAYVEKGGMEIEVPVIAPTEIEKGDIELPAISPTTDVEKGGVEIELPVIGNSDVHKFENRVEPSEGNSKDDLDSVKADKLSCYPSRKSFVSNIGPLGLLMPAVPAFPSVYQVDSLPGKFKLLRHEQCDLILAAAHIDDALKGRGTYGKARSLFKSEVARRVFGLIDSKWYRRVMFLNIILHSILIVFEPTPTNIQAGHGIHPAVIVFEVLCVLIYVIDITLHLTFYTWHRFWRKEEHLLLRAEFVLVSFFVLDLIMLVVQEIVQMRLVMPFRALRPFLLVCKAKNISHMFEVSISIAMSLGKALFIIFAFLIVFSAIGVHMFEDDYTVNCTSYNQSEGNASECNDRDSNYAGAFDNIGMALVRLFVLLTTENYPDFMLPAFDHSRFNFIYFGIFLYAGVFFLTSILVAIIVDSYWKVSKMHVKKERSRERLELAKAWNILDAFDEEVLHITDQKFFNLFRIIRPELNDEEIAVLIDYIDEDGDGLIDAFEWTTRLTDALQYNFEQEREEEKLLNAPKRPYWQEALHTFLNNQHVSKSLLGLIIVHQILFILHWKSMHMTAELVIQILKTVIVTVFLFESILRILTNSQAMRSALGLFDIFLCFVAFLSNILWYFVPHVFKVEDPLTYHGALTVVSCLAVIMRFPSNSEATKKFLTLFLQVSPVMFDLTIMVLFVLYFFAVLGMEIFSGYPITNKDDHQYAHYDCGVGFDTFGCAMLVVFQILTTSNWHEIMNGVMSVVHNAAALYFIPCFFILDMMIMNLVVAIAIEAFNKFSPADSKADPKGNEEYTFAERAMTKLNDWFATPQEHPDLERRTSLAEKNVERWADPAGTMTGARPSVFVATRKLSLQDEWETELDRSVISDTHEEIPSSTEEDTGEDEDYSGLTAAERKERQLKSRMKRNKKKWKKHKVIAAFRKKSEEQINLHVGDEVKVIKRKGEFIKGKSRGKVGWFPAKFVTEIIRGASKRGRQVSEGSDADDDVFLEGSKQTSDSPSTSVADVVEAMSQAKSPLNQTYPPPASPQPRERKVTLGSDPRLMSPHPPLQQRPSSPMIMRPQSPMSGPLDGTQSPTRKKILRNQGDWRRRILGDITIMNQDEMLELNRIVRTKIRDKKKESRQRLILDSHESHSEDTIPEETGERTLTETGSQHKQTNEIKILVEDSEGGGEVPEDEPPPDSQTVYHLKVSGPTPPGVKKPRPKSANGEMPEWAKKLVSTHNILVSDDVKPDEQADAEKERRTSEDTSSNRSSTSSMLAREIALLKERELTMKEEIMVDKEDKNEPKSKSDDRRAKLAKLRKK